LRRERCCAVCGQGDVVPVEPGYAGGFCVGVYSKWDGVKTCEDVLAERARADAEAKEYCRLRDERIEAERPRCQAFIADLNAICAKHGAHIATGDYPDTHVVSLEPRTYEISDDGIVIQHA
jgi:hypothetical protein